MIRSSTAAGRALRRLALAGGVGTLLLALGVPATALAHHQTTFTCEATALRVEVFGPLTPNGVEVLEAGEANEGNPFCADRQGGINDAGLPGGTASALFGQTTVDDDASGAEAGVVDAALDTPAGPIAVEILTSQATASCNRQTGAETFTGTSTIAAIMIGETTVEPDVDDVQVVPGGPNVITVDFAQQQQTSEKITQRAAVIEVFAPTGERLARVTIGEAVADVHDCNPPCPGGATRNHQTGECPPPPPPPPSRSKCNAGKGNGSEPAPPPPECDPGGSAGKNRGGD